MNSPVQQLASNPDWLLVLLRGRSMQFEFARVSRATYEQSPFLDHRITPRPDTFERAPILAVSSALAQQPASRPGHYVFHSAFCCSTLFARCLQAFDHTLVLREPEILVRVATARRELSRSGRFSKAEWLPLVRPVLSLLDKRYNDDLNVVIKPSNFSNALIDDVMTDRRRKALFMYGSREEFLISNLKKLEEGKRMIPVFVNALVPDTDYLQRLPGIDISSLNHLQQCVLLWHAQLYSFARYLAAYGSDRIRFLTAEEFLSRPDAVLSAAAAFFDLGDADIDEVISSGPLSRHSKTGDDYGTDRRRSESAAIQEQYGDDITATLRWSDELIRHLPVELPLQPRLAGV